MRIVWDDSKNFANQRKHRLSFDEASRLFESEVDCLEFFDEAHSVDEDRFLAIGPIARGIIVVVYTEIRDDVLRLISARHATQGEMDLYRKHMGRRP